MKNHIKATAIVLSLAMSFSTIPAFAVENENEKNNIISVKEQENAFYNSFTGTVKDIIENDNGTRKIYVEGSDETPAYFVVSENTYFVDDVKIDIGMEITGFYESGKPMIMIYPPQYNIEIIAPVVEGKNIKADKFDNDLLSFDKTLKLNISEDTEILWENGTTINWIKKPTISELETVLSNRKLIVLYDVTTKSIPAQTTPNKIIVLSEQENDTEQADDLYDYSIVINNIVITAPSVYINEDGVTMVPIRAISEALGYDVTWNNEERSVMIGKDVSIKIGDTNYVSSEGSIVKLEAAPIINDDNTYVPLNFFKEVINVNTANLIENKVIIGIDDVKE
nr:stalk domain-containing protein [Sedimentibacter sp.]